MKNNMSKRFTPHIETIKTVWQNKKNLNYAWEILNNGVCDGCALGTSGIRDWTMEDVHLCWIRLNLLHLNTMDSFDENILKDISELENQSEKKLRKLGRIPYPLIRKKGDKGFSKISWDEILNLIANRIKITDVKKLNFYFVSRGTMNETYYVGQKVARFLGTNNIDNSARLCHSPSSVALKDTIGYPASTCSYSDWIGTDLLIFIGSNPANNQPMATKYIDLAKQAGTKVILINPVKEPAMQKFWIPSRPQSAIFGTQITDKFYQVKVGGDIAFINGVLKYLIKYDWIDKEYIKANCIGWEVLEEELKYQNFRELEDISGVTKQEMHTFAKLYANAKSAVFVWSMGITMHKSGVDNVKAIVNLALSRGMIGRKKTGLVPLRGHSGVQGGGEMGAVANAFAGGLEMNEKNAKDFSNKWGFEVPSWKGIFLNDMIDGAERGDTEFLYSVGGNVLSVLPNEKYTKEALKKIPFRVYQDIVINPQMLVEPNDTVIILPTTTRYEMAGGATETTTERRVIFNPEIGVGRIKEAREEWRVLIDIAKRVKPQLADKINFNSTSDIREEIAKIIPIYDGIQNLKQKGDEFQWGGKILGEDGIFPTSDSKAHFSSLKVLNRYLSKNSFNLITRRAKQFNSMIFGDADPFMDTKRSDIILSKKDMLALELKSGDLIELESNIGKYIGKVREGEIKARTVLMYWPEANVLLDNRQIEPKSKIPAFQGGIVKIKKYE